VKPIKAARVALQNRLEELASPTAHQARIALRVVREQPHHNPTVQDAERVLDAVRTLPGPVKNLARRYWWAVSGRDAAYQAGVLAD
jgi:hypothetical protein